MHTIAPTSPLPIITGPVTIDGYTQPGSASNTNPVGQGLNGTLLIELDGENAGTDQFGMIDIESGNCTVRASSSTEHKAWRSALAAALRTQATI